MHYCHTLLLVTVLKTKVVQRREKKSLSGETRWSWPVCSRCRNCEPTCVYKIIIKITRNLQWLERETNPGGGWVVNAEERARGAGSVAAARALMG